MGREDSGVIQTHREADRGDSASSSVSSGPKRPSGLAGLPAPEHLVAPIFRHFEVPIWLQNVGRRAPETVRRFSKIVYDWFDGPVEARVWKINPFFPRLQTAPLKLVQYIAPKKAHKFLLVLAFYFVWLLIFITVLDKSAFTNVIPGYGVPVRISCAASFWQDKNNCGLNGNDCRPFSNTTYTFNCPAHCITTEQLNPHAVGAASVIYEPLVVGGPTDPTHSVDSAFYRGDSFICAAAIHAGYYGDTQGGCGVLEFIGSKSNYPAVNQNGIASVGFDSNFPMSFRFLSGSIGDCRDLRWPLLGVSVAMTALLSLFTDSPPIFFWSLFCIIFFHCALVADPPTASDYYTLVSTAVGQFLPAAFVAAVIYRYCVRRQLTGLKAQVEKTVLWVGACWVGALNDYTFDKIPIQRLTGHDLAQQPGAITALVIIVIVLLFIVIGQLWVVRAEGRLPRYLVFYALVGTCLGLLAAIPKENLRIHHYILGLLLLPGTAIQTRPSLLYQGLLVGLFINGIARWGFDSIIQTGAELVGDGQLGSSLPIINNPVIGTNNISFTWDQHFPNGADGLSVSLQ